MTTFQDNIALIDEIKLRSALDLFLEEKSDVPKNLKEKKGGNLQKYIYYFGGYASFRSLIIRVM